MTNADKFPLNYELYNIQVIHVREHMELNFEITNNDDTLKEFMF